MRLSFLIGALLAYLAGWRRGKALPPRRPVRGYLDPSTEWRWR